MHRSGFRDAGLIGAFCACLLGVLGYYLHFAWNIQRAIVADPASANVVLGRRCDHGFPRPRLSTMLTGSFQRDLEAACQDNLPRRNETLLWYRDLGRAINNFFLRVLPDEWVRLVPAGGNVVMPVGGDRLLWKVSLYKQETRERMRLRASYYEGLAARHPEVRLFVFPDLGATEWWLRLGLYGTDVQRLLDDGKYVKDFAALLSARVRLVAVGRDESPPDQLSGYYRTDHHWNIVGSWRAYRMIHQELARDMANFGPVIPMGRTRTFAGVRYAGSRAYQAMISGYDDSLEDGDFGLPNPSVRIGRVDASPGERSAKRVNYEQGVAPKIPFYEHYRDYFGRDEPLVTYINEGATPRSLLVVGDSMDNAMEPLLASHYHTSIFVDPRYYSGDLEELIRTHGVADVLFIGMQGWILGIAKPLE